MHHVLIIAACLSTALIFTKSCGIKSQAQFNKVILLSTLLLATVTAAPVARNWQSSLKINDFWSLSVWMGLYFDIISFDVWRLWLKAFSRIHNEPESNVRKKFGTTAWKQTSKDRGAIKFEFGHYKNISIGFTHTWNLKYDYNNQSFGRGKNTKRVRNRKNNSLLFVCILSVHMRGLKTYRRSTSAFMTMLRLHSHFCRPLNIKLLNWWNFYRYV